MKNRKDWRAEVVEEEGEGEEEEEQEGDEEEEGKEEEEKMVELVPPQ